MNKSMLMSLTVLAVLLGLLVTMVPAMAQGQDLPQPTNADGAGFATPPRDAAGPPASSGAGGGGGRTLWIVIAVVAVLALVIVLVMRNKQKS